MKNKYKSIIQFVIPVFLFLFFFTHFLEAGKGEIRFVETTVDLRFDGSAVVLYTIQWEVQSGEFHGFYFQNDENLRINRFSDKSYAVDSHGNRYPLSISPVSGDKWDIILANGKGVSSGQVTYVFYFETNFAQAGYLAATTNAEGKKLAVFHWAPQQWDEAYNQDHYTLKILTPHTIPKGTMPRPYVESNTLILTEKWVNGQYLIDYQRGENDRLLILFHKNNPSNMFHMRTQFYMPAEWFGDLSSGTGYPSELPTDTTTASQTSWGATPSSTPSILDRQYLIYGLIIVIIVFLFIMQMKHRSVVKAHNSVDQIRWENLDWTPPKLVLSTFHQPGKV